MTIELTVYGRMYCHLCDEMVAALAEWQKRTPFSLRLVDVDADPMLEARFGELTPVLMAGDREICHYHLDAERLAAYLGEIS